MKKNRLSIVELLVAAAIVGVLGAILFPVFAQARQAQKKGNEWNLKQLSRAVRQYSQDFDDRMPVVINGAWRNLRNVRDGSLTIYGDERSDMWPLLLLPYLKDQSVYVDPQRGDAFGIWASPAHATNDPGYMVTGSTYRNQSRFAMFGYNYIFLSPFRIPPSKMSDATPTDWMAGESHAYAECEDPHNTVFFGVSERGRQPVDPTDAVGLEDWQRGFSTINPPGMWNVLATASGNPYVIFWTGAYCSGDWCGTDLDPSTTGTQTNEGFFYKYPTTLANNAMFLDLHIHYMAAAQLAQGTDYLTATPNDLTGYFGGGAQITDKSAYLWNLNEQYYGA